MAILLSICATCAAGDDDASRPKAPESEGFWEGIGNFFLPHAEKREILLVKDTKYFRVTVEVDSERLRHLVFNPNHGSQGIWNPAEPESLCSKYCQFTSLCLPIAGREPESALFIGLGAGIIPMYLRRNCPETLIDIVEIDEGIPGIAEEFFSFKKDDRMRLQIADGREYANRCDKKYDAVFIDAYTADRIPFQLTTLEFFRKIHGILNSGGVMTANIAKLTGDEFVRAELKTVMEVFPGMKVFANEARTSYIVFAVKDGAPDIAALEKNIAAGNYGKLGFEMKDLMPSLMPDKDLREYIGDAAVLTDDYAPVETMK